MKINFSSLFIILLVLNVSAQVQQPPQAQKQMVIETGNMALVFSVGKNQKLYQVYMGEKLNNAEDYKILPNQPEA